MDAMPRNVTGLPVEAAIPDVLAALDGAGVAVLVAPPGAGKTTMLPLALLDRAWAAGRRIIVLEPRRIAARMAARRMADLLGEAVGETVGYRIRLETRVGPRTRIEVVTEGLFLRRLQSDPGLSGVAAVLFDEFHERSVDTDLALALTLEARGALREDLRLLVMSATLEAEKVAALLGGAPVVRSEGRAYPVAVRWQGRPPGTRVEAGVADAVVAALREESGDVLAFLPGAAEIRRTAQLLDGRLSAGTLLFPLYGDLPAAAQDAAVRYHADGPRRVILASAIAETSLTIEGVRIVVDSGLSRVARYDAATGMNRLETMRVTQASAAQRAGRAGRLAPGICYRLWDEAEHRGLLPFNAPEIRSADLAPLALELARWGSADAGSLHWLDPPPPVALALARSLLTDLGAIDRDARITGHGTAMLDFGLHPRLAHMVLVGAARSSGGLACDLAALLGERDILRRTRDADLRHRVAVLRGRKDSAADAGAIQRVRAVARDLKRRLPGGAAAGEGEIEDAGALASLAYPDRIARRRPGTSRFQTSAGGGAVIDEADPLAREEWLAIAATDGDRREARIFLAAPLSQAEIERLHAGLLLTEERVTWDERAGAAVAARERRLGRIVLAREPLGAVAGERVVAALLGWIERAGLEVLPWSEASIRLRRRVEFLRRAEGEASDLPDYSDTALRETLPLWLGPHLSGVMRRSQLDTIDLAAVLSAGLSYEQRRRLDIDAPTHLTVPSGSHVPVDYGAGETPVLAVRLQEMFGARETPRLARGRVAVLLHLLSPAARPLQVTGDLAGFWRGAYAEVRREMRGRYPKHSWPDDPLTAQPTARAKRRGD